MQHMIHTFAGLAAGIQIADVAFDEGEAAPGFGAHQGFHHVQVLLVTGEEVVQTHHGLPHLEQMFQQVGADETGNAGHQPGGGFGTHFFAQLGIGAHIAFLIRGRGCPPGGRENGRTRLRGTDGVLSLYAVPTPLSKDGPLVPAGAFLPHPAGIAFFCSHPVPARRAPLPLFSGKGCWYSP